jgi:predicted nucleic acid-binding protein
LTRLLIDTSVLIKWFHSSGERELIEARAIRNAHLSGDLDAHIVDLAVYEVGNVLVRALHWSSDNVADQIDDLLAICGTPLVLTQQWLRQAAALATEHNLSFYDAAWAATARGLDVPLVSADARLINTGLAESPTQIVQRLRLPMP